MQEPETVPYEHKGSVQRSEGGYPVTYRGLCACGWQGGWLEDPQWAVAEYGGHLEEDLRRRSLYVLMATTYALGGMQAVYEVCRADFIAEAKRIAEAARAADRRSQSAIGMMALVERLEAGR